MTAKEQWMRDVESVMREQYCTLAQAAIRANQKNPKLYTDYQRELRSGKGIDGSLVGGSDD